MLDYLGEFLRFKYYRNARIDGNIRGNERQRAIDEYPLVGCPGPIGFHFLVECICGLDTACLRGVGQRRVVPQLGDPIPALGVVAGLEQARDVTRR